MADKLPSVVERFIRYVKIDTESCINAPVPPSTAKQRDLGNLLMQELEELGATEIRMDEYGNVYGTVPANCAPKSPLRSSCMSMPTRHPSERM